MRDMAYNYSNIGLISGFSGDTSGCSETTNSLYTLTGSAITTTSDYLSCPYIELSANAITELWISFDVYYLSVPNSSNIRVFTNNHSFDSYGNQGANIAFDGSRESSSDSVISANKRYHFMIHVLSSTSGIIEIFVNGKKINSYSGNVFSGEIIQKVRFGENSSGSKWISNINISDSYPAISRIVGTPSFLCVTWIPSSSTTITIDTTRDITATQTPISDMVRTAQTTENIISDTYRTLANVNTVLVDTNRAVQVTDTITADTVRILTTSGSTTIDIDTIRHVIVRNAVNVDTLRMVQATETITADTVRILQVANTVMADTDRIVANGNVQTVTADLLRQIVASEPFTADTARIVRAQSDIKYDTFRCLQNPVILAADTLRGVCKTETISGDTIRHIPYIVPDGGVASSKISLSISLAEKTLSDSFSLQTVDDIGLKYVVRGSFLDMPYYFMVDSRDWTGLRHDLRGTYSKDKQLYTPFVYPATASMTAMAHCRALSASLGVSLTADFDDFTPTASMASASANYKSIISSLFGWTDRVPRREINVFLRDNVLHVLQRGHEPSAIDITDTRHTKPVYHEDIVRSIWGGGGGDGAHNGITIEPEPYTGTVTDGDDTLSYTFGLLMSRTNAKETTTYNYTTYQGLFSEYIASKVTETADETRTTQYEYRPTATNDLFLCTETETTVKKNSSSKSVRVTYHRYSGGGMYETAVYIDGAYQGSSHNPGPPSGKVSRYYVNQANRSLGSAYADDTDGAKLYGKALIDTEFPIKERAMLQTLTDEINAMDGMTEKTVSMTIYQYNHAIDFTDRITFRGEQYYLRSNNLVKNTRDRSQSVVLVRWY